VDSPIIRIRYDGGDADEHAIDMRLFGESLIGLDRIISDGIIAVVAERVPKRGERAPVILKTKEPRQGSVLLEGYLQEAQGLLALGMPLLFNCGADLLWDWVKGVVYYWTGHRDLAEKCMEALVQTQQEHLAARDRSEERAHAERMAMLTVLRETIDRLGPASAQAVAPIGPSVRSIGITPADKPPVEIDEPTADLLREHGEVELGELQEMQLRTDGFTFHTRKLSVEHPDRPGYLLADVQDPLFDEESNPYTLAAQRKALIRVKAKPGYRSGRLEKLYIMDFGGEVEDAASGPREGLA
jgi:hypothetical protein